MPTGEIQHAFDTAIWSWQFFIFLYQETGNDKWRRAAEATRYSAITTAEVENLSFYYQKSDDTQNLYTYPGTQSILIQNDNGYTDSRQVGGDKDGWLRLDMATAPPLQFDGEGKPTGPFPSVEVQNFAIVTGIDSLTTVQAEAAHSQGGVIEVGLSTDSDAFSFDQIYKQYWQLPASGAPAARTFNPRELIRWAGDYLTWYYQIAEDPIFTYQGGSGTATAGQSFETFTFNGVSASWLVGTLTLDGDAWSLTV